MQRPNEMSMGMAGGSINKLKPLKLCGESFRQWQRKGWGVNTQHVCSLDGETDQALQGSNWWVEWQLCPRQWCAPCWCARSHHGVDQSQRTWWIPTTTCWGSFCWFVGGEFCSRVQTRSWQKQDPMAQMQSMRTHVKEMQNCSGQPRVQAWLISWQWQHWQWLWKGFCHFTIWWGGCQVTKGHGCGLEWLVVLSIDGSAADSTCAMHAEQSKDMITSMSPQECLGRHNHNF